jgi:GH15 family glucan-1,4-alpha-glucosidase
MMRSAMLRGRHRVKEAAFLRPTQQLGCGIRDTLFAVDAIWGITMAYKKVGDYGVIGNGATLALVGRDGALDWMCLPYMDSPSVFAALLDDEKGGHYRIGPDAPYDSAQAYLPRTNILQTRFRTSGGEAELEDFLAVDGERPPEASLLLRRARVTQGSITLEIECAPRFDYARLAPVRGESGDTTVFTAREERLTLFTSRPVRWQGARARVTLAAGETLWLALGYGKCELPRDPATFQSMLDATRRYWEAWVAQSETGRVPLEGWWQEQLDRTALVLKLLQLRTTGAIAAAGTTSLPAIIGGERNWDYRLSWIRDTSMTLAALYELGHVTETERYLGWLKEVARRATEPGRLSIVYRLQQPLPPGDETELAHLAGYKNSRPVRIGQFVIHQRQHDIYGELLDALFALSRLVGKIRFDHWALLLPLVEEVIRIWREPDDGIWEARIGPRHYVHSKLMCWVALDRAIKIADHYGFPGDIARWDAEREAIRAEIMARGYNAARGCFTQHYDTEAVDAALLLVALTGFLPVEDARVAGTIAVIERELLRDRAMLRYELDDGLDGQEQGFMICLFWYLHCLILQGRLDEVDEYLREIGRYTNHLGLFGEQYEPRYQEITGNFPQAYSHIGYATAILRYREARRPRVEPRPISIRRKLALLLGRSVLNDGAEPAGARAADPAQAMKRAMNVVRGQFYDGHARRVDYAGIRCSEAYGAFRDLAAQLASFDPASLESDAQRVAFWTNVFNTLVIHGVVELGIHESVREVPFFFECIRYRVGGEILSASDIEHGILRANAVPPYRLRRRLCRNDPRGRWAVHEVDSRIHFALVCASRTCPPIEAYDAAQLEEQLDAAAQTFINATTRLHGDELHVCEIFRWYRTDFGAAPDAVQRLVARYLYDREAAARIEDHAGRLRLVYTRYDWRLNR